MHGRRIAGSPGPGLSGRDFGQCYHMKSVQSIRSRQHSPQTILAQRCLHIVCQASQANGGIGAAIKNFARKVQSGLPIVGLLSRLATDIGGIGNDEMAYPEFARNLLNISDAEFSEACKAWSEKYGQVGQRKYILLFLWMARTGLGFVPNKKIVLSATRLRVTQDIEIEVERFEAARKEALEVYSYDDRPKGRIKQQVAAAVDSLCRLSIGLKDGEAISQEDQKLLTIIIPEVFKDIDEPAKAIVIEAVSDASRAERRTANQ